MSRRARQRLEVARWEFLRYIKPKEQVAGLVITFAMLLGGAGLTRLAAPSAAPVELAVVGAEHVGGLPAQAGRFRFRAQAADRLPALRREVEAREREAVLVLGEGGAGELYARQAPAWADALGRELTGAAQHHRLRDAGLDPAVLAAIQAPYRLEVREAAPRAGRGERIAAFAALVLTLIGLFSGISYIFSSVTGEKQNRLSEQVISTIPPQVWIDGKILGLAAVSLVAVLNALVSGALSALAAAALWGWKVPLPERVQHPGLLLLALFLVFLGFLFWFAFLTAVAAVVDDPHTSTRNQLVFLPAFAMMPSFLAVSDPDATWVRVLSLVPPTSGTVLPARLLVAEVAAWEIVVAVGLLVAAIWAMRRLAGKVFRLGMLMYGKEPTWAEVRRWVREA